jgi:type I restriction-modification system DNA methylase subunit
MFDYNMSISNKEALKDKIHEIHNYLRNNGAGYGMNALKLFNIIYGLKKIEENNLLDKVNLKKPDCEFSYLLKLANENKDEELAELMFSILTSISKSNIRDLLFYEIPTNIKGSVFSHLIKEINKITLIEKTCNVLLSGKIYEYFIGRDLSAISDLGAYFTDRHIVDYIYDKIKPTINEDGTINSMIDMFGGSGGFTTGYINYLNKNNNINWSSEINKIYHYDMNEDVIKSAGLEFFCLTGILPNMTHLKYKNSFTDEFIGIDDKKQKYKYIFTNPPYGGDKNNKSQTQIKRDLIKKYIKNELKEITDENKLKIKQQQLKKIEAEEKKDKIELDNKKVCLKSSSHRINKFAKKYELSGNDKESISLILMMELLDINGTCIGVLKEGVFFNKTYKDLRKVLIENFNVKEVISIPSDQFENTTTKTSIIIFDNTEEKTTNVIFRDLIVERYQENKFEEIINDIILTEMKDDIKGISDIIISQATKEELLNNNICSLNGKDYTKKKIKVNNNYKLVKLGNICEFLPKSKRNASFGKVKGKYNFYTSSDKVQKCDIADYNEESIIIGDGGIANIKLDSLFSCSDHNYIIKSSINRYIYYLIKGNMNLLIEGFSGSVLKNISKEYLKNLEIPIPKSEEKINYWIEKISGPYDKKNKKELELKELELEIQNKIKDIIENEDCINVEFDTILKYVKKENKYKASDGKIEGLYKFYTSSQYKILYRDDYEFKNTCILIGRGGNVSLHIASYFSVSHDDVYVLNLKKNDNDIIMLYYIFNYLKLNINLISNSFKGSTIKHSSKESLSNIKIKIPKNKDLINNLEPLFNKIKKLQTEIKENEILYNQYIQELLNLYKIHLDF